MKAALGLRGIVQVRICRTSMAPEARLVAACQSADCATTPSLWEGVKISPTVATEVVSLRVISLVSVSTSLVADVSEDDARRRRASRVPQTCPECVRVFSAIDNTKVPILQAL